MWTRRSYIKLCSVFCFPFKIQKAQSIAFPPDGTKSHIVGPPGCGHAQTLRAPGPRKLLSSSGDLNLDNAIRSETIILNKFFSVKPFFSFHDDGNETEALALSDGVATTILLGINLINNEKAKHKANWGTVIVGVMAHEWAHALQYRNITLDEKKFMSETHADFMAGWYLGFKKAAGLTNINPTTFSQSLFAWGYRGAFFDPDQYGSSLHRVNAMLAGLDLGQKQFIEYKNPIVDDAANEAYKYALKLGKSR